ncbi:MAG: trypsin-like peptidase domain-containing protein [Planctomycetota bacterium]
MSSLRAQLLHLSGPYRGRTVTYAKQNLLVGTASGADVHFPIGQQIAERHAEVAFAEEGRSFSLKARDGKVSVNGREVHSVALNHGDLLELGVGGPKLRFRVCVDPGRPCKPIRLTLSDAREVGGESGLVACTHTLRHDLLSHSSRKVQVGFLIALLVIVAAVAFLGASLGGRQTAREQEALRQGMAEGYENELAVLRERMEEFRHQQAGQASREEVEELRADLARRAGVVDQLVQRNAALKTVLEVYSHGVCLVHGIYTFKYRQDDQLLQVVDIDGDPLHVEYIGSGFLATTAGHVITNRHVAEPWWNNETAAPLLDQGLIPEFVVLTASFPGRQPITVDPSTIRLGADEVDTAVFEVQASDVPVLPLHSGGLDAARGGRVIVLGYPTGLNGILARAESDLISEVLTNATDTQSLIVELAQRGAISPVITQGALNEVKERRLVYDAETTSGGSGGPVFGPDGTVIGVNFAITPDFDGSNFGVPIEFARKLLP